eukprot:1268502-Alexandrium_andersonii.AAC.1
MSFEHSSLCGRKVDRYASPCCMQVVGLQFALPLACHAFCCAWSVDARLAHSAHACALQLIC